MKHSMRAAVIAAAALAASACGPSREQREGGESVAAAAKQTAVSQAGEVIGARREAQPFFDDARASLAEKDRAKTAVALRGAAAFMRQHADSATDVSRPALVKASEELTELAARASNGGIRNAAVLDSAFARAQLADAQFHCVRALAARQARNLGGTGAEMLMITDHLERGVADAKMDLPPAVRDAIAGAQATATRLAQGSIVPDADVDAALSTIDTEVHAVLAVVSKPPK